jgi:hypothetical protein
MKNRKSKNKVSKDLLAVFLSICLINSFVPKSILVAGSERSNEMEYGFIDELSDYSLMASHTSNWDFGGNIVDLDDGSTIFPQQGFANENIVYYNENGIHNFLVNVFGGDSGGGGSLIIRVYESADAGIWSIVELNATVPEQAANNGYWYRTEVSAKAALLGGTKYIKIEILKDYWVTQLGFIKLAIGDSGYVPQPPVADEDFINDEFADFTKIYEKSSDWILGGSVEEFNDASTLNPNSASSQYISYYSDKGIKNFSLTIFGGDGGNGSLTVKISTSADNVYWTEIPTSHTPAETDNTNDYWVKTAITPAIIGSGTKYLKIEVPAVGWKTQLGCIEIDLGDSGEAMLYNSALLKEVTASSGVGVELLTDGRKDRYWVSNSDKEQELVLDLGEKIYVESIAINWGPSYAKAYSIAVSDDGGSYENVYATTDGVGGAEDAAIHKSCRFVAIALTEQGRSQAYTISELQTNSVSALEKYDIADDTPPTVDAGYESAARDGALRVNFNADDSESGVAFVYVEVENALLHVANRYESNSFYIALDTGYVTKITYYANDFAGNASAKQNITIGINGFDDFMAEFGDIADISKLENAVRNGRNAEALDEMRAFKSAALSNAQADSERARLLSCLESLSAMFQAAEPYEILDADMVNYPWLGYGYNHDPLNRNSSGDAGETDTPEWDDEKFNLTAERIDFIRPAMVRLVIDLSFVLSTPDSNGDGFRDYIPGESILVFDNPEMQAVYKWLDYYRENDIPVMTGIWNDTDGLRLGTQEYADFLAAIINHLINNKGYTNIEYVFLNNELNYFINVDTFRASMEQIAKAFDFFGLDKALIVSSDSGGSGGSEQTQEDIDRAYRTNTQEGYITYALEGITNFEMNIFCYPEIDNGTFAVFASSDNQSWTHIPTQNETTLGLNPFAEWSGALVTPTGDLPAGTNYLKFALSDAAESWTPQIGNIKLIKDGQLAQNDALKNLGKIYEYSDNIALEIDYTIGTAGEFDYVNNYEFHLYGASETTSYLEDHLSILNTQLREADSDIGKPYFLGEHGMADMDWPELGKGIYAYSWGINIASYNIMLARAGLSGALAWALDGYGQNKQSGMWDKRNIKADANEEDYRLRPWFYHYSLMSRYFPAKMQMYAPIEKYGDIDVLAGKNNQGFTAVFVNRNLSERAVEFVVPDNYTGDVSVYAIGKAQSQLDVATQKDGNGFPAAEIVQPRHSMKLQIPAEGMVLITTLDHEPDTDIEPKPDTDAEDDTQTEDATGAKTPAIANQPLGGYTPQNIAPIENSNTMVTKVTAIRNELENGALSVNGKNIFIQIKLGDLSFLASADDDTDSIVATLTEKPGAIKEIASLNAAEVGGSLGFALSVLINEKPMTAVKLSIDLKGLADKQKEMLIAAYYEKATKKYKLIPYRIVGNMMELSVQKGEEVFLVAYTNLKSAHLQLDDHKIVIDGRQAVYDVSPFFEDGKLRIPLRAIAEAFGCDVEWIGASQTVVVDNNGKQTRIAVSEDRGRSGNAIIKNDRTYVTPEIIKRVLDAEILFDEPSSSIHVYL